MMHGSVSMLLMHSLALFFAVQLVVFLGLNVWIWRSNQAIPERMLRDYKSANLSDVALLADFIIWCGRHHKAHAPVMVGLHAFMMQHMMMDIKIMGWSILGWTVLILVDLKTARVSQKARVHLKLNR
ncbi:MAG: hypothetical protein ABJN69_13065 [Hellea sp.]